VTLCINVLYNRSEVAKEREVGLRPSLRIFKYGATISVYCTTMYNNVHIRSQDI